MPGNLGGSGSSTGLYRVLNPSISIDNIGAEINLGCIDLTLMRPADASQVTLPLTASNNRTINLSVQGEDGRDQAANFDPDATLFCYYIWNGSTLAGIASLNAPTGLGPTLPVSYTHWAYVGAVHGRNTIPNRVLDVQMFNGNYLFETPVQLLTNGGSVGTAFLDTSIALYIPLPILALAYYTLSATLTTGAGGAAQSVASFNGGFLNQKGIEIPVSVPAASQSISSTLTFDVARPNSNDPFYSWGNEVNAANIATRALNIYLRGYRDPYY